MRVVDEVGLTRVAQLAELLEESPRRALLARAMQHVETVALLVFEIEELVARLHLEPVEVV